MSIQKIYFHEHVWQKKVKKIWDCKIPNLIHKFQHQNRLYNEIRMSCSLRFCSFVLVLSFDSIWVTRFLTQPVTTTAKFVCVDHDDLMNFWCRYWLFVCMTMNNSFIYLCISHTNVGWKLIIQCDIRPLLKLMVYF